MLDFGILFNNFQKIVIFCETSLTTNFSPFAANPTELHKFSKFPSIFSDQKLSVKSNLFK